MVLKETLFEVAWNCHHVEIGFRQFNFAIFIVLLLVGDAIARVFHLEILEVLRDVVKVSFVTK